MCHCQQAGREKSRSWALTERPPAFFGRIKAHPLASSANGPAALLARLERTGGGMDKMRVHRDSSSAKADPIWAKEALTHNTPQHWLLAVTHKAPWTLPGRGLASPQLHRSSSPPPQTVARNLPATADGTSSFANEPAGSNSYIPLTLIRVSFGHSSVSITSLRLWIQGVNLGPPLGWPPSSQPPSESCCLTVP